MQGIKVVDSDSKKKVKKLLKAEAAMKMDIDDGRKKRGRLALRNTKMKKTVRRKLKVTEGSSEKMAE